MVDPSFVGRDTELRDMRAAAEQARRGKPGVVEVQGPPGMGKTALVRRFVAEQSDLRLIHAVGDRAETSLPFGVLEQLLADADPGHAGEASPPDALVAGGWLLAALGEAQASGPLLLWLDDAHWADRASLVAATFALRRLRHDRVVAVVGVRTGEEGWLPEGLRRLVEESAIRLQLVGLDASDVSALAMRLGWGRLPPPAARRLCEQTEGNPLYVRALLAEVDRNMLLQPGGWLPAPRAFSERVLARREGCAVDVHALVDAASVFGRRCRLADAAHVGQVAAPLVALEQANAAELLESVEGAAGTQLVFPHPLVRAAVYGALGADRRARLHARAAEVATGDAVMLHRVAAAGPADVGLAVQLRALADQATAEGRMFAAAQHLLGAARVDPAAQHRHLQDAAGLLLLGQDVAAAAALLPEIEAAPPDPRRQLVLGLHGFLAGELEPARRLLADAAADPLASVEVTAAAGAHLAWLGVLAGDGAGAVTWAQRALAAAPSTSPVAGLASGLAAAGMGIAGRARDGLAFLAAAARHRPPSLDEITVRGILRLWTDDLAGAIDDLSAAVDAIAATGPRPTSFPGLANLCLAELRLGRWDDLVSRADFALSLAQDSDAPYSTVFFHALVAMVHACRGQWAAADTQVNAAQRAAAVQADPASHAYAALAAAWLATARSDPQTALDVLAPLVGDGELDGTREPGIVPWRHLYADALMATGRLCEAGVVIDRLAELAGDRALPSAHIAAARARGRLHTHRGDYAAARNCLEEALDWADQVPMPFERALTEADLGRLLRRTGNRRQAHLHLTAAQQQLAALGAVPFLLASDGLDQSATPAALTSQEHAVARLVAGGRTNREAAAQLFVSVKTVEYHLGNVYAKFGIHSRSQLTLRYRDQNIPPPSQHGLQGDAAG